MKYKGIIFDLDGVLCSTDRFHFEAWKQTAEEVGAPFDETINMKLRGVSRMESLEIILSGSSKTFTDTEKERLATEKNDRYRKLLANVEGGLVFSRDGDMVWQCSNCGHIVIGKNAPEVCPVCAHPKAYFQLKAENY
jgi:rubrerythrin